MQYRRMHKKCQRSISKITREEASKEREMEINGGKGKGKKFKTKVKVNFI